MARKREQDAPEITLSDGSLARIVPSPFTTGYEVEIDGTPQSHVDLDDQTHLHFEYIARMGAVIDQLPAGPLTAVHLGAGGMTLPRYIAATRPGSRQQVVEWEQLLIDLVRESLPLPPTAQIRVRIGDARRVLEKLPAGLVGQVDLLVSDVYSGAQTPAHVTSLEFFRHAARVLSPAGLLLVNVADGPGLAFARRQLATISEVFTDVAVLADVQILKGRRFGNLVVAASQSPLPTEWLPRLLAAGPHPAKLAHGDEITRLIGGATAVTDHDASASPLPRSSLFDR